jgi:hypothetical protein
MAMYVDDGVVDAPFFERMSNQWREDHNRCPGEIANCSDSEPLDHFIQRKGGINECAARFSRYAGRRASARTAG